VPFAFCSEHKKLKNYVVFMGAQPPALVPFVFALRFLCPVPIGWRSGIANMKNLRV